MKSFIKKRWKYIVAVIDLVYNVALGLPFYLMTLPCLTQHFWSPIFSLFCIRPIFWGCIKSTATHRIFSTINPIKLA